MKIQYTFEQADDTAEHIYVGSFGESILLPPPHPGNGYRYMEFRGEHPTAPVKAESYRISTDGLFLIWEDAEGQALAGITLRVFYNTPHVVSLISVSNSPAETSEESVEVLTGRQLGYLSLQEITNLLKLRPSMRRWEWAAVAERIAALGGQMTKKVWNGARNGALYRVNWKVADQQYYLQTQDGIAWPKDWPTVFKAVD